MGSPNQSDNEDEADEDVVVNDDDDDDDAEGESFVDAQEGEAADFPSSDAAEKP